MSHEIEMRGGKASMAYFGEVPWHGLGNALTAEECLNLETCMDRAGANWEAEKVKLVTEDKHQPVDHYAVRRKTDNRILGTVGERYEIVQNKDAFGFFAPFIESGEACIHTAGCLREGSRIWVLAKLNRDPMVIVKDDTVQKFVLLSHSHDGTLAVRVGFTPIRTVCANTLAMAHSSQASKLIRCKHSKKVLANLENIRDTMNLANAEFEATAEQYRRLCRKDINEKDLAKYLRVVLAIDEDLKKEDFSVQLNRRWSEIMELIASGKGNDAKGVKDTWWAAYNGVTEYLSYCRGRNADSRIDSLWYGDSFEVNKVALETALEMAA